MEIKKSEEANINKSTVPLILCGSLFVSSLILASFSYKAPENLSGETAGLERKANAPIQTEEKVEEETPPPPPEQVTVDIPPPPDENTQTKENEPDPPKPEVLVKTPVITAPVTQPVVQDEIVEYPDVEATFPGGSAAMQRWISENVNYPQTSIEMNEQGRVYLSFVVEKDGSITNVSIVRSVSPDLDREAKRLVRAMPRWTPGISKGENSRTKCNIPINFKLN